MEENPVQVEDRPPERIVAAPVPVVDERILAPIDWREAHDGSVATRQRHAGEEGLEPPPERRRDGVLIALRGRARREMRQPVLLVGRADHVLQPEGDARLLVALHLRHADQQIGSQHGLAERVLVPPVPVVQRGEARVAVVEAKPVAAAIEAREAACGAQVDGAVAAGIAGQGPTLERADVQAPPRHRDVVEQHARHDLEVAQVDELEGDPVACPERLHHRGHAERGERVLELSALERRLGDRDRPVPIERPPREVDERTDDGRMRAAAEELVLRVAVVEVPGAHEVGLDDDVLPGPDERGERIPCPRASVGCAEAEPLNEPELVRLAPALEAAAGGESTAVPAVGHDSDAFVVERCRHGRVRAYQRRLCRENDACVTGAAVACRQGGRRAHGSASASATAGRR